MVRFTIYMSVSMHFRSHFITWNLEKKYKSDEIRIMLYLLDAFDIEAEKNEDFRNNLFKWFRNEKTHSTLELRDLAECVGYSYWDNLAISNLIDSYDAFHYAIS